VTGLLPWPCDPVQVNTKALDPSVVGRWAEALGWSRLRGPGVKTVPHRVHLDLLPHPGDDKAAEVARLRTLGATDLDLGRGDVPWTCLADPEVHEFCVLAPS
jgi:Glyoxalase-like domain